MKALSCKTFEKEIDSFFDDDLDSDDLEAFLAHSESCRDCREELTIRLLIREGLKRLEDGRAFHLGNEYDRMLRTAKNRLKRRFLLQKIAWFSLAFVILAIVTVVVIAIFVLL
jgi:hypothetical protein